MVQKDDREDATVYEDEDDDDDDGKKGREKSESWREEDAQE